METIPEDSIKALCKSTDVTSWVESLSLQKNIPVDDTPFNVEKIDICTKQKEDEDLSWWRPYIASGKKPDRNLIRQSNVHQTMYRNFEKFHLQDDIVYRKTTIDGQDRRQLVIPRASIPLLLEMAHNEMGHQGRDKTSSLIRDRFYWCGMSKDIEDYIKKCHRCICRKTPTDRAPLVNITTHQPLELVCMDFLSLETSKGGFQNILVITDHFTRYAVAVPTRNQTARTTAEAFLNHFVVHYGLPKRIHSDQGANFESRLIKEICELTGMSKSHTTPYHPMGNGLCERFNRTLLSMLGTLDPDKKKDWKSHVTPLVHAYNSTRQESTGFCPYLLMFGREPNLPLDLVFGLTDESQCQPTTKYAEKLQDRLRQAYELATRNADKARGKQKENYDQRVRSAVIQPGDIVLVRIVAFEGKHKLSDRWEDDPYLVITQPNVGIPVYKVQKQSGTGRIRTLHRNMLLPLISTDGNQNARNQETNKPTPAPRRRKHDSMEVVTVQTDSRSESEDSEDEIILEVTVPEADTQTEPDNQTDTPQENDEESSQHNDEDGDAHDSGEDQETVNGGSAEESDESEEHPPQPAPRRPQRNRRPPAWIRSGEYVMAMQSQPEWVQRAEYLRHIGEQGVLQSADVANTILKIVSTGYDT